MASDPRRLLVTGASGLIGHELCRQLGSEWKVLALGRAAPDGLNVEAIPCDLAGPHLMGDMPPGVDTVVHLAQSSHFRQFPDRAPDIFEVNVGSTTRLLDWAWRTGVRRFVYASSGGIYGHGSQEFREEDPIGSQGPLGFYLASKHCGELLVENYAEVMTVVILRFFFVYGPRQRHTMLIPRLLRSVRDGQPIRLQGEDGLRLNPIHATDAAGAVALALDLAESQKINIAGPQVYTLRGVAETMGGIVGREPVFEIDHGTPPGHLVGDITKMSRLLRAPVISLRAGVASLALAS
jgi:UDP-glucose 4-epimerase